MTMRVYYLVGQPRSGSTFVGDWIARRLEAVNAGEVWQTMLAAGRLTDPTFDARSERWGKPEFRAAKRAEIEADPFWAEVLARPEGDPYAALLSVGGKKSDVLVDTSKTDHAVERYRALGCDVTVVHTIRAFSTWAASVRRYRTQYDQTPRSRARLLLAYLRRNRQFRNYRRTGPYILVPQEKLGRLEAVFDFPAAASGPEGAYLRCEMFGTPSFRTSFDADRADVRVSPADRLLYALVGCLTS
ncbi:hypothetical protein [Tropicimonas sp. IMCC6043]|uniref:hypothetical protein n=1 Tax=Tropicimonas sp. IMCC6043 TaxID=2510645 RepID=UPI00101BF4F5|nr:hypothetical protein [Tropicimonas sp. IMCC6043]RYH07471.1 hypothetical protein EU800_20000 [Tropicimonas sp. IMCC6043]